MGKEDLTCGNKRELRTSVAKIKEGYDEFDALCHLQTEFMERHEAVAKDVYRTAFSNGAEIISNFSQEAFSYKGQTAQPLKFILVEKTGASDK